MTGSELPRRRLLTRDDAAAALCISKATLDRLTASGELPVVRIGARVFIEEADLEAFLDARKTTTTRQASRAEVGADRSVEMGDGDDGT
jgi:excisionase family DNA binding protein